VIFPISIIVLAALPSPGAQTSLRVAAPLPATLDLRDASPTGWVPAEARDPAQVEAVQQAWQTKIAPFKGAGAVRILLPSGPGRLPLLLAASQALKAQDPAVTLYLGFQGLTEPLWDEAAWGAVQGAALTPEDLGPDPERWGVLLLQAQTLCPGRPWTLWLPADPGPRLAQLLGDGARLVLPAGGAGAALAAALPADYTDLEGGLGDLTVRLRTRETRRWRFADGAWTVAEPPRDRHEVTVTAQEAYDVGALVAKVRATQLAARLRSRSQEGRLEVALHLQAPQGPGADLAFRYRFFQRAGEPFETLQEEVLFNGVRAKLNAGLRLPIVESQASQSAPVALSLTERYRYRDGGAVANPGGPALRRLTFAPVDPDPGLYTGTLLIQEADGRIREERSERSGLRGVVQSERRTLTYGEAAGAWQVLKAETFERWLGSEGVAMVQRTLAFSEIVANDPDFLAHRQAARASNGTMLQETLDGQRYFVKQADGTRKVELRSKSNGRAIGGLLLIDPTLPLPVIPLAGLAYYDFNAFDRGVQVNLLTAVVFNTGRVVVPKVAGGFDLSAGATVLLLPGTERPVHNGHVADREGVSRTFGDVRLGAAHDLGAGFRFLGEGRFRMDSFSEPKKEEYRTPGFTLPPSGWTRELRGELTWQYHGLQVAGSYGRGQRPEGVYGAPGALQAVPDQGAYTHWAGRAGYDFKLGSGAWLHGETGVAAGTGFDRFKSLDIGGTGGDVRVAGIRNNAIAADRIAYGKAGVVLPSGRNLRLTLTLDHAQVRSLDDRHTYGFTGLGAAGDLPGFWWFTTVRLDLGLGLASTMPGVRSFNGYVAFLRVF